MRWPRRQPEPPRSRVQLAALTAIGVGVGLPAGIAYSPSLGPLLGWDVAALGYLLWTWRTIWPLDAAGTARLASREDPSRPLRDALLLAACLASLFGVGMVLLTARSALSHLHHIGVGIVTVLLSWAVVHSTFTARYARLYYTGAENGGVEFNQPGPPRYSDFAYLAFTVGMTFQISDTNLTNNEMRKTVLSHALVSYLFGAVIIAVTVSLLATFAK